MIALLALAVAAAQAAPDCAHDRAALLALPEQVFDQDMTGGWRALATKGCDAQAADLIRDWRARNRPGRGLLLWHEGQLRADAGQTAATIALFERARRPAAEDRFGWNPYVDGSIAFLRRDRLGLEAARAKLAALPEPVGLNVIGADGKPRKRRWPPNLNVLDGFLRCWDQPYKLAYRCAAPNESK